MIQAGLKNKQIKCNFPLPGLAPPPLKKSSFCMTEVQKLSAHKNTLMSLPHDHHFSMFRKVVPYVFKPKTAIVSN